METRKKDKQTQTHSGPGEGDKNGEGQEAEMEMTPEDLANRFHDATTTRMENWKAPVLVEDEKKPGNNGK